MTTKVFRIALLVFSSAFFYSSTGAQKPADTLNRLNAAERAEGFTLLFNGKDLDGWRGISQSGPPATGWAVEQGILHVLPAAEGSAGHGGDIITTKKYQAFDLRFDFRLTNGANSGVKYFVMDTVPAPGAGLGLEYQVLDDEHHPDAKLGRNGDRTLGSLYDLIPADKRDPGTRKPIGEWNHGRIVAGRDGSVQHWLNGVMVLEYARGGAEFRKAVAESKFKGIPGFGLSLSGPILLQDHGNSVFFANIRIRELK
jgi:hypothetical protein